MDKKKPKLGIGLILNSFDVPLWTYLLITKLKESNHASISVIIHNSKPSLNQKTENLSIQEHDKGMNWMFDTYIKYEKRRIRLTSDLVQSKNCKEIFDSIEKTEMRKILEFNDFDVDQIRRYDLDAIINLSSKKVPRDMLDLAKFGVWSYRCMNDFDKIDITGFWEVYENKPVTCTVLEMSKEENNDRVIDLSFSFTDPLYFLKNRMNQNWKKTIVIPRKLKKLHENGEGSLYENIGEDVHTLNLRDYEACQKPTNIQIVNLFFKHLYRYLKIKKKYRNKDEQWCLLFYLRQKDPQLQKGFQKIMPPKDRFYADPFIVKEDNNYIIFIEEFVYRQNKGHISYLKINQDGEYSKPKKILECPYHLSYPFVFKFKSEYYMIPETSENKSIDLYVCTKFPDKWKFVKTLVNNITALDSTILEKDGKWWLFTSASEMNESPNDILYLFYSDDLLNGEWIPHPKNPIVSDVRKARSAGKLFKIGDNLYRPAQDCSIRYGRGIKINMIKTLNEKNYEEISLGSIRMLESEIEGTHTYSKDGDLTMFDFKILKNK